MSEPQRWMKDAQNNTIAVQENVEATDSEIMSLEEMQAFAKENGNVTIMQRDENNRAFVLEKYDEDGNLLELDHRRLDENRPRY